MTCEAVVHIVDDDVNVLESTAMLLKLLGHRVRTWNSAFCFLEQLSLAEGHIVLLDLRMPEHDGFAVFRKLRAARYQNAVVLMTGHGDSDLEAEAIALGLSAILHKPFSEHELIAAIEGAKVSELR
ncbi:MAG: DNA-binding response regulator [Pseudomonadota bacterium]|jgi:two-component system response regulator FixJ